ncbi:hypothetical protein EW146_g2434 [Bondarzewia mesenterica]|uniref:Aminoacyl-transfer RNA synthetases class-II family profile domain-containing protein n=1 Tax=Bondarzewia mesenterica TaxID=1095465 RepID=A0A4S4M6S2_9AGAM|nr:hypothetical protein EW146_g2434 [Bondarzewia mesenterica]
MMSAHASYSLAGSSPNGDYSSPISDSLDFLTQMSDSFGTTQLVVLPQSAQGESEVLTALSDVPVESTVLIEGEVTLRPEKQRRPEPAGDVEVQVKKFTLLNPADRNMPFLPSDTQNLANEDLRMQYRYLDLRRSELSANLRKRSHVAHVVRTVLNERDFLEVETPVLLKSTPEGAREFLVPTRQTASSRKPHDLSNPDPLFYALPQSPQQPKQLLMCSGGVDRYYQLARCFRDEDGRKDRQPEFTQVDMEMAFVSWGPTPTDAERGWRIGGTEVREVIEDIMKAIWAKVEHVELPDRFRVMTYGEAMRRFGSDKPDTRFGLEVADVKEVLPDETLTALRDARETIECLVVRASDDSAFISAARECHTGGAAERVIITEDNAASWLRDSQTVRLVTDDEQLQNDVTDSAGLTVSPGDIVWLSKRRDPPEGGSTVLGRQRLIIAETAQALGKSLIYPNPHLILPSVSHD